MAETSKPAKSKSGGGCLGKLVILFLLAVFGGIGTAAFFIVQPQDLMMVGGYGPSSKAASARDLKVVLQNSIDRKFPVTLTETEINQWLGRTLVTKQGGLLAGQISLERVWVRLEEGLAEVVMERRIMGRPFTVSMFLQVEQLQGSKGVETQVQPHGGPFHESLPRPLRGGRFGKLVVPQGFLLLVLPSYEKLAALFHEEIHLGFEEMSRIKIENNRLVLDPRDPADHPSKMLQTF